jgi:hypothetical protein
MVRLSGQKLDSESVGEQSQLPRPRVGGNGGDLKETWQRLQ